VVFSSLSDCDPPASQTEHQFTIANTELTTSFLLQDFQQQVSQTQERVGDYYIMYSVSGGGVSRNHLQVSSSKILY